MHHEAYYINISGDRAFQERTTLQEDLGSRWKD